MRALTIAASLCGLLACSGGKKEDEATPGGQPAAKPTRALADAPPAEAAKKVARLDIPAGEEGAKALLGKFLAPGADTLALSRALRPKSADYAAVFAGDAAKQAEAAYGPAWDADQMKIAPKEGQSNLLLWAATTEDIQGGAGNAREFPGGWASIKDALKPGVTWYRFKFTRPGETLGMAFDGLVHVNGRWVVFPKPYRALK